jgi:hypothetical protein
MAAHLQKPVKQQRPHLVPTTTPSAPDLPLADAEHTGPDTPAGRRYIESPENDWRFFLFVRENKEAAYCALGPATKVHIEGDRPMSLHWKLEVALPMELFRAFSVLRA